VLFITTPAALRGGHNPQGKVTMNTYYLIRRGWNSANQPAAGSRPNPRDTFESRLDALVEVVHADNPNDAVSKCSAMVYANQTIRAVSHPQAVKGLTREVRTFTNREFSPC
jgi:hypothetical protein